MDRVMEVEPGMSMQDETSFVGIYLSVNCESNASPLVLFLGSVLLLLHHSLNHFYLKADVVTV